MILFIVTSTRGTTHGGSAVADESPDQSQGGDGGHHGGGGGHSHGGGHSSKDRGASSAAIGGAIGGGIAALLLLLGVFWYFLRRWRQKLRHEREQLKRERLGAAMVDPFRISGGQIGVPVLVAQQPPSYRGKYGVDEESGVDVAETKTEVPEGQKLERTAAWVASAPSGEPLSPVVESSAVLPSLGRFPSNVSAPSPPPPVPPVRYKPAVLPKRPSSPPIGDVLGRSRRIPPPRITPDLESDAKQISVDSGSRAPGGTTDAVAGSALEGKEGEYSNLVEEMYRLRARVDMIDTMRSPTDTEPLPNPFEDPPSYIHTPRPELGPGTSGGSAGPTHTGGVD